MPKNGIFGHFGPKISKFKVDALPHGWTYRPGRWLKMTLATSSTKQEPKTIFYLTPSWCYDTLTFHHGSKTAKKGQIEVFMGSKTPQGVVRKKFFRYPSIRLDYICLYSKFQIFPTYGSLGQKESTNFPYWALWAPYGRKPASESKIPPFTQRCGYFFVFN